MKHVLLIANLDGQSVPLLRYASRMCKDFDLKLHILRINPDSGPVLVSSPYYVNKFGFLGPKYDKLAKKELETYVHENTSDIIESDWVSIDIMEGNIDEALIRFMNRERIDLVITRRKALMNKDLDELEFYKKLLINISEIPLLLVPENQTYKRWNTINYLTTFTQYDFINIHWLKKHFPTSGLKVTHCNSSAHNSNNEKWVEYLQNEIDNSIIYEEQMMNLKEFISSYEGSSNEQNLLCMTTRKRNFWSRLINPSTTMELVTKTQNQVLIFKHSEETT